MTSEQQQSISDFLASIERRRKLCIRLTLAAIALAIGFALASCRSAPDAFDQMFEAAAQQGAARMREPVMQKKTWMEWRAEKP